MTKNWLERIKGHKFGEVTLKKELVPANRLEKRRHFNVPVISLREALLRKRASGIIGEIKRRSPSQGVINANLSVEQISKGYQDAGVSALSVLTDSTFFGGSEEDLVTARAYSTCPILRKEFILDEYQILESRSIGADAILLIAAMLEPNHLKRLCAFAHSLGLEVLMEVHDEKELERNVASGADLVGVNNRNLKSLEVSINTSKRLADAIPHTALKVSESGIHSPADVIALRDFGYKGFLIGQTFMQSSSPELKAKEFIMELKRLESK